MVLCALPSTLEGSQPQGGSSLQEKEATVSKSSPLKETAPEFINGVNGAIRRKKKWKRKNLIDFKRASCRAELPFREIDS